MTTILCSAATAHAPALHRTTRQQSHAASASDPYATSSLQGMQEMGGKKQKMKKGR